MRFVSERWHLIFALLFICSLLSFFFMPGARADGGAPNLAYVSGTSSGVSAIDVGQAKITKTIAISGEPQTILLSQDGGLLYVSQPVLGKVSIVRASTGLILCTARLPGQPSLLAIDPDLNILYAAGSGSPKVTALDPTNCKILNTFTVSSPVYGLAVALSAGSNLNGGVSNQLWIASTDSLTIFDDQIHQILGTVPFPDGPQYLSIPPGETVYVTTRQGNVDAVSLQTRQVRRILNGGIFGPMDYDALTGEVYVPDALHKVLNVLSPVDMSVSAIPLEPERVIHTQGIPEAVAITSDGLLGFIALREGKVAMWDLIAHRLVYTVNVGGTPRFVITGLYPPPVLTIPTPESHPIASQQTTIPRSVWVIVFSASLITIIFVVLILVWQLRRSSRAE